MLVVVVVVVVAAAGDDDNDDDDAGWARGPKALKYFSVHSSRTEKAFSVFLHKSASQCEV